MYICNTCGRVFEEPRRFRDDYDMGGGFFETFAECPCCGGGDFEEMDVCRNCGKAISESQAAFHLCKACEDTCLKYFRKHLRDFLNNEFNECERELISWAMEGIDIIEFINNGGNDGLNL